MKWLAAVIGMIVVLDATGATVVGQDAPRSRLPASQFLPDATAFGEDWVDSEISSTFTSYTLTDAFVDAAAAAYGGPAGTRIVLAAMVVTTERVATRTAWEEATLVFEEFSYRLSSDTGYVEGTVSRPPAGCQEGKRVEGSDSSSPGFAAGVTLCATDADVILLAFASGEVDGLRGAAASDRAIELALAARAGAVDGDEPAATPVPDA